MARPLRIVTAGEVYHVVNRGNDKRVVFREAADYERFIDFLNRGKERADITILGFCLMPTHFHLLLQPGFNDALSAYMQWVTGRYAFDLRQRTGTLGHGHIFQRRYWASEIHGNLHLLTNLRYIESNPIPHLVTRAEDWRWSSLYERNSLEPVLISPGAIDLPSEWNAIVNMARRDGLNELLRLDLRKPPARPALPGVEPSGGCQAPTDPDAVSGTDRESGS